MNKINFTENNTPQSQQFDDIYYNVENGLAEKYYVFIEGNDLPNRFPKLTTDFNILELGFGTGLSFLLTAFEFAKYNLNQQLNFTSTELYPLSYDDINKALANWPELYEQDITQNFIKQYKQQDLTQDINIKLGNVNLKVLVGDARQTLKVLEEKQDCFYLDGFAPSKNPVMWGKDVFAEISRLAKSKATCATYSASRIVKDILTSAQFLYKKRKGFGKKRDMLVGVKE